MRTLSKIFDWQVVKKSIIASIVILTLIASRSDLYAKTEELQFDHPLDVGGILFNGGFIQDRDGFFWIATQSGLVKYDGYDLKKYTSGAPGSISSDVVFSIYEDSDGILWCTTSNGLNRYDKNTDSFTVYKHNPDKPNSISHNVYNWANQTIAQDGDGNLWFGTQRGLNKFDKFTEFFTSYAHDPDNPESLGSDNILAVFIDKQNVLWVGTDNGLDKFDASAETFIHYGHEPNNDSSLSHNVVGAIFEDEKGGLWVGTRGGGLNRFEKETESFTRYLNDKDNPDSISDNFVYSINEFERGEIWVAHGGDGIGLDILDAGTGIFTHYKHEPSRPNSLSNDHIMNVYEDSTGIIWTVIFDGKLDKLDNESEKFKLYQHDPDNDNSVGDNVIFVVFEDEDGIMWIGSDTGGLDRYDPKTGTFAHYKHDPSDPNSLPDSYVIGILEDSDGNFWLMSDNLWLFDRELGKVVRVFPIEAEYGSTIIEDSENSDLLWIATSSGGLGKFEKNTQTSTNYTHDPNDPNSISNNVVWQIFQDREGMIWIPTYGGGLDKFDPNTGKVAVHYKHDPDDPTSIGSDTVNHVYQDSEGNIWVGVVGGGLNKLNVDGTFTRYTEQNGFLTNNVTNIIEDDNGFLWLGTKIGLVRFDPKTEATKLYTQSDGLQSNEFWEYPHLKTRDGQLWVYGANGANSFYPDALEDNPYTPPVVVTSLTQGGEKMNVGKAPERVREITLDWQYNYFEFEFVALNYTSPEKNQYKYMLEGVDQDWYDSGTRRFGRYTGLPPGDYVLRIIGSNNDGVWNEEGVSISVTVTPPFWRTWWFIALCVAGVFGVLGTIYQARIQRSKSKRLAALALQESEARLRQVVENMPVMLDALDANGNNIVWNKECERVTGYSAEEIVNNPQAMELLYPDAAYRKRMLAARAERGDDYYDWEWQITCKDGTVKTVAWSNISRRLPIPGWATWGIGVNITERKRAEELLRESESKLRKLFERSTDAIFLVDTETGRYLDANRAAEILTGRSVKEITTLTTNDITPANARERLKTVRQTLKETTTLGQIVYQRPDGTERLVLLSAIPIQDNLVFGLAHDITERVQVEKERELLLAQIRVQARQMQGIIDTVPEGVLLLDADGRVVLANPVAKQDMLTLVGQDIISTHDPITRLGDRSLAELLTSPPAKGLWHETKANDR
ncbi:MAG: PAS domain S-box protein, partial [Chloroflexi bacterium]|nr:PAS domain S-box protein [Chloroflexota bacterium]